MKRKEQLIFLVDEMLFPIAQYLRFMGYNTIFAKNLSDNDILKKAKELNAIVITSDKELFNRSIKYVNTFYVPSQKNFWPYFASIIKSLKLKIEEKARCQKCNALLLKMRRSELKRLNLNAFVPKGFRIFYLCPNCNKLYWKGSQWKAVVKRIKSLKSKA
jgi:uncharacterized protein with PIN domain